MHRVHDVYFFNADAESRLIPVSIILTDMDIALAEENHQWPLPRFHEPPLSLAGPQFVFINKQRITNITEAVRSVVRYYFHILSTKNSCAPSANLRQELYNIAYSNFGLVPNVNHVFFLLKCTRKY